MHRTPRLQPFHLLDMQMRTHLLQQLDRLPTPQLPCQEQRAVAGSIADMYAHAAGQQLPQDIETRTHGRDVDGRVAAIVGGVEEVEIGVEEGAHGVQVAGRDGVAQGGEGGLLVSDGGHVRGGVLEDRGVELGHLAAEGRLHLLDNVLVGEAREGEQVGELGEGGFGGEVVAEDDAGSA